jgi:hypothetical protein
VETLKLLERVVPLQEDDSRGLIELLNVLTQGETPGFNRGKNSIPFTVLTGI